MAVVALAFGPPLNGNTVGSDVASAATLPILSGDYFAVTGTTNIDYISTLGSSPGKRITLKFGGNLTLNHNTGTVPAGTGAMFLAASGNVAVTTNDVIRLVFDGTLWRQETTLLAV